MNTRKLFILMDGYPRPRPKIETEDEYVQKILVANREAKERVGKMSPELRKELSQDSEGAQWLAAVQNYDENLLRWEAREWYKFHDFSKDNPIKISLEFPLTRS